MPPYKPIPVDVARKIAEQFDKSMVVILAYDPEHQLTHTTTYGVLAFEKEQAAAAGRLCADALGSDLSRRTDFEDFHQNYDPARLREAEELMLAVDHALASLIAVREGLGQKLLEDLRSRTQQFVSSIAGVSASSSTGTP